LNVHIREERSGDIDQIHEVTVAAFLNAPHADGTEQFVVAALRNAGALTLSLVAEEAGRVVGHVALSPVTISDGSTAWYGLGPISVVPGEQGKGVGSLLMKAALDELGKRGANGCVLLGDPGYYQRFGFSPIEGLVLPGVPPGYFQAILFRGVYPRGEVTYHEAFEAKG